MSLADTIPGLAAAIEQERFVRDSSFLSLPETICGVDVQPLTLRHVVALSSVGSPFMCGGAVAGADVLALVKIVGGVGKARLRWLGWRIGSDKGFAAAMADAKAYLDDAFQDSPGGEGGESVSYYSFAASIVDVFGTEYGWRESDVLDMPLKRLWQYLNAIRKRHTPDSIMFNPSDRVRGDWLKSVNTTN